MDLEVGFRVQSVLGERGVEDQEQTIVVRQQEIPSGSDDDTVVEGAAGLGLVDDFFLSGLEVELDDLLVLRGQELRLRKAQTLLVEPVELDVFSRERHLVRVEVVHNLIQYEQNVVLARLEQHSALD